MIVDIRKLRRGPMILPEGIFGVMMKDGPAIQGYEIPVYAVRSDPVTQFLVWTKDGWSWEAADQYEPFRYYEESYEPGTS